MDIHESWCLRSVSIKACSVYHIPTYFDLSSSKCVQVRYLFISHIWMYTLGVLILTDWINTSLLMMLQCKIGIGELCEELLINSSFYLDHTVLITTLHNSMLVHVACLQACVFVLCRTLAALLYACTVSIMIWTHVQVTLCSIKILCVQSRRQVLQILFISFFWKQ